MLGRMAGRIQRYLGIRPENLQTRQAFDVRMGDVTTWCNCDCV